MLLKVFFYSLLSAVVLFILIKLMGEKQISQMNMFDYVNGITIGSIAAEMATNLDRNPLRGIVAMAVYAALSVLIAVITQKSVRMRKILAGSPIILMDKGEFNPSAMRRARIDLNEFLMLARIAGYYDISQLRSAIMEENGTVSFLPYEKYRPLTPCDVTLSPQQTTVCVPVVIDGRVNSRMLNAIGKTVIWLNRELEKNGVKAPTDLFLAIADKGGIKAVFSRNKK